RHHAGQRAARSPARRQNRRRKNRSAVSAHAVAAADQRRAFALARLRERAASRAATAARPQTARLRRFLLGAAQLQGIRDEALMATTRRDFIKIGAGGILGAMLARGFGRALAAPAPRTRACVVLWLNGGPSHTDTFDPKAHSKFKKIATRAPAIELSE